MTQPIEKIVARVEERLVTFGDRVATPVLTGDLRAVLDALKEAQEKADKLAEILEAERRNGAALHAERDALTKEAEGLRALLVRAGEALAVGDRLVDYFANNRTGFAGSGTPATFIQSARALASEIAKYLQTGETGT